MKIYAGGMVISTREPVKKGYDFMGAGEIPKP